MHGLSTDAATRPLSAAVESPARFAPKWKRARLVKGEP